jgi:branched-chain amino acid transport system permease protein
MSQHIRPAGVFDTSYDETIALNRTRLDKLMSYGAFVLLLIVPLLTSQGPLDLDVIPVKWLGIIIRIAIFAIAVHGLNILLGYTGQISLGHAAFMAVGAYSSGILVRELGFSFWTALPVAALFTGIIGLIFGLPSLRVKGFYLAMATLAAQFIIPWVIEFPLEDLTNGSNPIEIPVPTLFGFRFENDAAYYYIVIPLAVLLFLFARNVIRTRVGRAFISIRDNDLAAELLGINVFSYKLQAFFLSSLYAGIAGTLMAFNTGNVAIETFQLTLSINLLAMLIIGGAGYPLGALFGVIFVNLLTETVIPGLLSSGISLFSVTILPPLRELIPSLLPFIAEVNIIAALNPLLFGLALAAFLILEPRGIAYRWEILKIAWKIRPYSY